MTPTQVVFDIGGVLTHWDPVAAFAPACGGRQAAVDFMDRVGFHAKNARADAGALFGDLAREIDDPNDRAVFDTYLEAFPLAVTRRIKGSWAYLEHLKEMGIPVHAITNWSFEAWPRLLIEQPRLGEVFDTLVVSGQEGVAKPQAAIFQLFCERADVAPEACFFVDDGLHNVQAARAFGMQAAQFISPKVLGLDLSDRGLL